ncbi:MAG: NfeD family protein, partial [Burkholderiaceae bacterium]
MEWSASTWWWIAAGLLVAGELATGTFYVLMLAAGCVVAALAAYTGIGLLGQIAVAIAVGGGAVLAWRRNRLRTPASVAPQANPDINLDIGERVPV